MTNSPSANASSFKTTAAPSNCTKVTEEKMREEAVTIYLHYTKVVLPELAQSEGEIRAWPIKNDHCFQRVVLDTVCQKAWYEVIPSPAYKNLSLTQALAAKTLCERIAGNLECVKTLNNKSKAWRKKQASFAF